MAHYCTGWERKTLTLGCPPPLLIMVFTCLCLLWRWWRILAWSQILWGLRVMVVAIFGFVVRQCSLNTLMTLFPPAQAPIHHGVPCTYLGRGLQGGNAINQVGWWWVWHLTDKAEYLEVHNLDKEEPEGGAGSPWVTDSLWYQGEPPSHTCLDPFYVPDPLLQVPARK